MPYWVVWGLGLSQYHGESGLEESVEVMRGREVVVHGFFDTSANVVQLQLPARRHLLHPAVVRWAL